MKYERDSRQLNAAVWLLCGWALGVCTVLVFVHDAAWLIAGAVLVCGCWWEARDELARLRRRRMLDDDLHEIARGENHRSTMPS